MVRDAGRKSIGEIAIDTRCLKKSLQSGTLSAHERTGATFSIINLGVHGVDAFTPIIDLPQCAVLGVGRLVSKPAICHGEVVARQMVFLSLSFDHRIVAAGTSAQFLNMIRQAIEHPQRWVTNQ